MISFLRLFLIFFIFLISSNATSQIVYEDSIPVEFQGIWTDNCAKPTDYIIRLDKYTAYEASEYGTFLDIPKLRIIDEYLAVIYPGSTDYPEWYTFLKIENENLIIRYEPEDFNNLDFSFLDEKDDDTLYFVKCKTIPNEYKLFLDPINKMLDENVINNCIEKGLESLMCVSNLFNYFDIYNDRELTVSELTQMAKVLINYFFLDGNFNNMLENVKIEDKYLMMSGTSFAFAPSFAQLLLVNYDYNNSDTLSLDELLNNKSDFINIVKFIINSEFTTIENIVEKFEDVF